MRHILLAPAALLLLAAPIAAQQQPGIPGTRDPAKVTAGTYVTDPAHTLVGWRVDHLGFNDYFGIFGDVKGRLTLDPANLAAAKVDITVPLSGLTTASAKLTEHMNGTDFFEVAKHPEARFVSTGVTVAENGMEAEIAGNLTIKGITKPVTLRAQFTGAGAHPMNKKETVGFEAATVIKRSDFGMSYGLPMVSDEVGLDITVAFEKQ
mgnify:CR=1 FL=1